MTGFEPRISSEGRDFLYQLCHNHCPCHPECILRQLYLLKTCQLSKPASAKGVTIVIPVLLKIMTRWVRIWHLSGNACLFSFKITVKMTLGLVHPIFVVYQSETSATETLFETFYFVLYT